MECIIYHIDVNSASLSWEAVYRISYLCMQLDLRSMPSAVGDNITMRQGIILAKSIPTKKYGIKTSEIILEAKRKYPNLTLVPPHYELYEKYSTGMMNLLCQYSDMIEQYSIDGPFVDMSSSCHLFWKDRVCCRRNEGTYQK